MENRINFEVFAYLLGLVNEFVTYSEDLRFKLGIDDTIYPDGDTSFRYGAEAVLHSDSSGQPAWASKHGIIRELEQAIHNNFSAFTNAQLEQYQSSLAAASLQAIGTGVIIEGSAPYLDIRYKTARAAAHALTDLAVLAGPNHELGTSSIQLLLMLMEEVNSLKDEAPDAMLGALAVSAAHVDALDTLMMHSPQMAQAVVDCATEMHKDGQLPNSASYVVMCAWHARQLEIPADTPLADDIKQQILPYLQTRAAAETMAETKSEADHHIAAVETFLKTRYAGNKNDHINLGSYFQGAAEALARQTIGLTVKNPHHRALAMAGFRSRLDYL